LLIRKYFYFLPQKDLPTPAATAILGVFNFTQGKKELHS
jgi:hypothetical protein